jgi:hypothetical protein
VNPKTEPLFISDTTYFIHKRWMTRALELAQAAGDAVKYPWVLQLLTVLAN